MATKYCPKCQATTNQSLLTCPQCSAMLSLKDPYSLVGQTLLDRYQLEALVGLGGMGAVYCAFHTGIERRVAFKVLQPNIAINDERLIELFEREAKVAGRLTHENIVDVKDAGRIQSDNGSLAYIVMEWLDGRTLEDELHNGKQLNFAQTNEILQQMASALAEAHAKNVIHRDLKPANVMLVKRATAAGLQNHTLVKVLDFGIGKIMNEKSTAVSAVMGTPSYASPEQLQLGSHLDHRSDIYSLGVMLYRMLAGRLPFVSQSLPELMQMQLAGTATPLSVYRPDVPPAIETLVHRMLAKEPALRPQSVQEVAATFAAALQGATMNDTAGLTNAATSAPTLPQAAAINPITGKTELMTDAPTPRRFEIAASGTGSESGATASAAASQGTAKRFPLIPTLALALVAGGGGFALYRYASNQNAPQQIATVATNELISAPKQEPNAAVAEPTASAAAQAASAAPSVTPKPKIETKTSPSITIANPQVATPTPAPTNQNPMQAPPTRPNGGLPVTINPPPNAAQSPAGPQAGDGEGRNWPVADSLFNNALKQYEAGNYQAALELCNKALAIRPRHQGARALKQKLNSGMKILQGRP